PSNAIEQIHTCSQSSTRAVGNDHSILAGRSMLTTPEQTCTNMSFFSSTNNTTSIPVCRPDVDWNGPRLAETLEKRPDLASLVREVRHHDDTGFEDFACISEPLYKVLAKLPALQQLVLRKRSKLKPGMKLTPDEKRTRMFACMMDENFSLTDLEAMAIQVRNESELSTDPLGLGSDPTFDETSPLRPEQKFYLIVLISVKPISRAPRVSLHYASTRKLCITGGTFDENFDLGDHEVHRSTALEDLILINCRINLRGVFKALKYPKALKSFTFRGPGFNPFCHTFLPDISLLEYRSCKVRRHFVFSQDSDTPPQYLLGGRIDGMGPLNDYFPWTPERLTLCYEKGSLLPFAHIYDSLNSGYLLNLHTIICDIPDNLRESPTSSEIRQDGETWKEKFQQLNVDLFMVLVPYPTTMPAHDACSCECLRFYHRFDLIHPILWRDSLRISSR
ncbi:hypothetical protein NUU61_001009, partial [Penicillium alfredii]